MMIGVMKMEWKDIPMELLLKILSQVDDRTVIAASGVCREWKDVVWLGLSHLSLTWCKKNMNKLVLLLAPKLANLHSLILRQEVPQLEDIAIEALAYYCHDLQELDLTKSIKLTDRSMHALGRGCPNLTKLNLSVCSSLSDVGLTCLAKHCTRLKSFNLCGCGKAVSDSVLQAIGHNCNELQYLNLGWCDNVSDVGVMSLAEGCPDLRNLDLCDCVRITDDSVIALANKCPHLQSLDLYFCRNITDKSIYSLVQSRVKNMSDSRKSMKNKYDEAGLKCLNISQCTALTPQAVQTLCDTFPSLHTCFNHFSLVMSGCSKLTSVRCICVLKRRAK